MSEKHSEAAPKEIDVVDDAANAEDSSTQDPKDSKMIEENQIPSQQQEEEIMKKKYGGLLPKKPPLISKDHERAFFDSADWALGKQGSQKSKGPSEALRPKLQPTPHQQARSRRSLSYAPSDESEDESKHDNITSEDEISTESNHLSDDHRGKMTLG